MGYKTIKLLTAFIFLNLVFFALPLRSPANAQCGTLRFTFPGGGTISTPAFAGPFVHCIDKPADLISAFLGPILIIAGFLTVIIIIISGIQFVTSGGNPEAAAAARGRLTFAIIGFVIIVLAFAILQIVDQIFLGTNIT